MSLYTFPDLGSGSVASRLKRVERTVQFQKRGIITQGGNFRTVAASQVDSDGNIIIPKSTSSTTKTNTVVVVSSSSSASTAATVIAPANYVLAGPTADPVSSSSYRALVPADIPILDTNQIDGLTDCGAATNSTDAFIVYDLEGAVYNFGGSV